MGSIEQNETRAYEEVEDAADRTTCIQLALSCIVPFALKAAISLGVPGILMNAVPNHLTAEEIAKFVSTPRGEPADGPNLDRILRVLASHGLLKESLAEKPGYPGILIRRYGASRVMKCLHANKEGISLAPSFMMLLDSAMISPLQYLHFPILDKTVEPFVLVHGKPCFEWAAANPQFDKCFNEAMSNHSSILVSGLLAKYHGFESVHTLVDVGGGHGTNINAIVSKYPHIHGINFDQPHVVKDAPQYKGVEHVGGNFFESVPKCDAVFMKWILHDWSDEKCLKILKNIEKTLPADGKIINMDYILPEGSDTSSRTKSNLCGSLLMMAINSGGKERTLAEFRDLVAEAGFARIQVITTVDNLSVLEFHKK